MKIIIPTCDKYRNILEANKYTMDKFGGSNLDVIVLGYKKPNFDLKNWKFVSLGVDNGPDYFTNDIWKFFKDFDDEYFIYGNDDVIAVDHLDLELIDELKNIMDDDKNIVKISLTSASIKNHKNFSFFNYNKNIKLREIPQNAEYRLSLHYGMWRTSYFKKYFKFNINPWQWELRNIAKNDGALQLSTYDRHFLDFGHIYRRGNVVSKDWYKSEYTDKMLNNQDKNFVELCIKKNNKK